MQFYGKFFFHKCFKMEYILKSKVQWVLIYKFEVINRDDPCGKQLQMFFLFLKMIVIELHGHLILLAKDSFLEVSFCLIRGPLTSIQFKGPLTSIQFKDIQFKDSQVMRLSLFVI